MVLGMVYGAWIGVVIGLTVGTLYLPACGALAVRLQCLQVFVACCRLVRWKRMHCKLRMCFPLPDRVLPVPGDREAAQLCTAGQQRRL